MKFIFLIAAFNAFFFTLLLAQKKPRDYHDNILIAWLIYLGLFIGIYSFYSHEVFTRFRMLSNSFLSLFMLHGPFLYLYVSFVSGRRFTLPADLLHGLPFILFNLYIVFASFHKELSAELNIERVSAGYGSPELYIVFLVITALSGPFYIYLTMKLFRKIDNEMGSNFSTVSKLSPGWLKRLIIIFGVVWTALITVTVIHHVFNMFSMVFCTDGLFLSLSVFVILIGYFGLKQKVILSSEIIIAEPASRKQKAKYSGSKLTGTDSARYASELSFFMKKEEPYLNPELTLAQLSESTGIPANYLSQVINEQFGRNFFDFVNKYRVEAFTRKVSSPEYSNYSLLGIAFECGFNSKTAFNRVFRQVTGKTPSEYRKGSPVK